jgi:predicted RNase H-like HicB family nuclease
MNIRTEFEEKSGRWVATIPEVREVVGYGSTRIEASIEAAACALCILKDEPEEIWIANLKDLTTEILIEAGDTPDHIEEVMAELDADD